MTILSKCPVCVTTHSDKYMTNDFNIKNYDKPVKNLRELPRNTLYHISRIFLFNGLNDNNSDDFAYNANVTDSIFIKNKYFVYDNLTRLQETSLINSDNIYTRCLNKLLKNEYFKSLVKLGRFLQTQINDYLRSYIPGNIVITIDDLENIVSTKPVNSVTENYKLKIKLCYYKYSTVPSCCKKSPENYFTSEDLLFRSLVRPYEFGPEDIIPITSWTVEVYDEWYNLGFDEKDCEDFSDDSVARVDICKYAMKHIMKYTKKDFDDCFKYDSHTIDDGFILYREKEDI